MEEQNSEQGQAVGCETTGYDVHNFKKGAPAFKTSTEYIVIIRSGEIRKARFSPTFDFANMLFTDCTHPMQNAFCGYETILFHCES